MVIRQFADGFHGSKVVVMKFVCFFCIFFLYNDFIMFCIDTLHILILIKGVSKISSKLSADNLNRMKCCTC